MRNVIFLCILLGACAPGAKNTVAKTAPPAKSAVYPYPSTYTNAGTVTTVSRPE